MNSLILTEKIFETQKPVKIIKEIEIQSNFKYMEKYNR